MVPDDAAAAQFGPGSRVSGCRTTTTPDKADGGAVPSLIRCCGCRCTGCPGIASISYGPSTPPLPVPDQLRRPYSLSIAAAPVGCVCVPVCSGHRGNPPFLKSHLRMCARVPAGCACLVFPRGCPPPPPPALLRPPRRRRRRRCRPRRSSSRASSSFLLTPPQSLLPLYGPSFPSASLSDFLPPPVVAPSTSIHPLFFPSAPPPPTFLLSFNARRERETCVREKGTARVHVAALTCALSGVQRHA